MGADGKVKKINGDRVFGRNKLAWQYPHDGNPLNFKTNYQMSSQPLFPPLKNAADKKAAGDIASEDKNAKKVINGIYVLE